MRRPMAIPGRLLAAAFPDRIAQRRGEPGSFRLAGGGGARLPRADPLANAPLLAVAALELKASARIRLAAPLDPDTLPRLARITEQVETSFDPVSGAVLARRRRRFGALVLGDRTEPADPAEVAAALGPRGGGGRAAAAALDRAGAPAPGARGADAPDRTRPRLARPVGRGAGSRRAGMARAAACWYVAARRTAAPRPARHPARPAAVEPGAAAGRGTAGASRRCPADAPRSTTPSRCRSLRRKAQAFYGLAATPTPGRRPGAVAARPAVPGGAAGCHHRRPRGVLARRLGRRAARHARALSEARLAGRSVRAAMQTVRRANSCCRASACHLLRQRLIIPVGREPVA